MSAATVWKLERLRHERAELHREISDLDALNKRAGSSWNVGWGKTGGIFDKKLDRLRGRLLLLDAQLAVLEAA